MNYIYDIVLNFQPRYYEFFEWNKDDEIAHVKKIPVFLIDDDSFFDVKFKHVIIDTSFIKYIYNKCELFKGNSKYLNYAFIVCNGSDVCGILCDKNGLVLKKSSLLFEEGDDVCSISLNLNSVDINYIVLDKNIFNCFVTRNEHECIINNCNYLKYLFNNKQDDVIKYLYFECYNEYSHDIYKAYSTLLNEILNNGNKCNEIGVFFDLIRQ